MKDINSAVDLFEATAQQTYKCYYGFNADAPAPSLRYELTFEDADNPRDVLIYAVFTALVVGKLDASLRNANITLIRDLQTLKARLINAGFEFVNILDAIEFDNKGNVSDTPAKIIVVKMLVEF